MPSFRPDQAEIMDINRKLEKLLLNSTSDRFALFYASPLSSNLIHQLDLEGAPMMVAMKVTQGVYMYGEQMWKEFKTFVEAQTPPSFTNLK